MTGAGEPAYTTATGGSVAPKEPQKKRPRTPNTYTFLPSEAFRHEKSCFLPLVFSGSMFAVGLAAAQDARPPAIPINADVIVLVGDSTTTVQGGWGPRPEPSVQALRDSPFAVGGGDDSLCL